MSLSRYSRGLQFGTCNLWGTTGNFKELKGRSAFIRFLEETGKGCFNQRSLRRTRVQGCGSFSLAAAVVRALLLGQGGILLFLKHRRMKFLCEKCPPSAGSFSPSFFLLVTRLQWVVSA